MTKSNADAEVCTLPAPTRAHIVGNRAVIVGQPQKGWDEESDEAHNCDAMGCSSIGPHVLFRVPLAQGEADQMSVPQTLPEFLDWAARELERRDAHPVHGIGCAVAESLRGRAIILRAAAKAV